MIRFLLALSLALFASMPAQAAESFETNARTAVVVDYATGRTLFEKNADEPIPTASMSKMMTIYMLLEQMKSGALTEDDTFTVSEKAWRKGGSKMFIEVGKEIRVIDLLRGIVVQSGNDASIVVAEGLAGSEEAFAEQMTQRARELGLTHTTLKNATGWPDPEHKMSTRDLARLAALTIRNFPHYYKIYAERSFTYNDIKQGNRNPLLYRGVGADGLKTGHTEDAGYGLTASAVQDGQRLVMVVTGLESTRQRAEESERLLQWAFRTFGTYRLFQAGDTVDEAEIWLGERPSVPLRITEDLSVSFARSDRPNMEVAVVYDGPVPAPVAEGDELARLEVRADGALIASAPLVAAADVAALGPMRRVGAALSHIIWGPGG